MTMKGLLEAHGFPNALPIEHELVDGAWYVNKTTRFMGQWLSKQGYIWSHSTATAYPNNGDTWLRMGPIAEYRSAAAEPKGLGAVVRDARGGVWVRESVLHRTPWRNAEHGFGGNWQVVKNKQPVEVLSEGVEL